MRSKTRIPVLLLLVLGCAVGGANAEEIPGSAHAEARALLASGDGEAAATALDAIVSADRQDAEALVLRGAAHELAAKHSEAWQDYHDAAELLRNREGSAELTVAAIAGSCRTNDLLTAVAAAAGEAVTALEAAIVGGKTAGDWEVARQAAVAILRLDPLHAGAQELLKEYWQEPSLRGLWIDFFDPSLRNTEKPEGVWEPLTDRDGYEFRPNDEVVDTAEIMLPVIDAPQDNYEIEGTFEVQQLNTSKERTLALGWGRGDGSTLVLARFADSRLCVYQQTGGSFTELGDNKGAAIPNEGREFTIRLTVRGGDMHVSLNGEEILTREDIASKLSGLPFLLTSQNTRTKVWNLRFRYRPADGGTPDKDEVKEAAKAIKKADPGCVDDVDAMLADSPNDPTLLLMRAEAAAALERKDAVMAYRRALEESPDDKKLVKTVEKVLKKLAAPNPVADILEEYAKAVSKAKRDAPRGFDAADLRILELRAAVIPPDKADAKAWQKLERDEKTEGEWTQLSLDPGEACSAVKGDWKKTDEGVEGDGSTKEMAILATSCVVSESFDLAFDCRMLLESREASGFQIGIGDPLLVWTHGYPALVTGLATGDDLNKNTHVAKKRRDHDNEWHSYRITVDGGFTTFSIDGDQMFRAALPPGHENLSGRLLSLRIGAGPIQFRNLRYRDRW